MTMTSILSYPKFFLSGICRAGLLSRQRLSLLRMHFLILFLFRCMYFFPPLHAFSSSLAHFPVTHADKHTALIRPFSRTCDTRSWTPGPVHRGRGVGGRGRCPVRASGWRWTWLLSTESRHSYTMGPFTHMSDSVADWGRGTLRMAPSLVGGPWKLWYGSA